MNLPKCLTWAEAVQGEVIMIQRILTTATLIREVRATLESLMGGNEKVALLLCIGKLELIF